MKKRVLRNAEAYGDLVVENGWTEKTTFLVAQGEERVELTPLGVRKLRKVLEKREAELVKMGELEATP